MAQPLNQDAKNIGAGCLIWLTFYTIEGAQKEQPCHCQLCQRAREIAGIKQQRRELSLASIYRKDYRNGVEECQQQSVPQTSARKNQSSNFHPRSKSFLEINSTYLANYQPALNSHHRHNRNKSHHIREEDVLESYVSTYSNVHRKLPVLAQESYKIADLQAYNADRPFPKQTEYSKNYLPNQRGREKLARHKNHNFDDSLRLFETTQKQDYLGKMLPQERAVGPSDNMTTLPSSSFLYNTTYKQEFLLRQPSKANPETINHCYNDKYRF